MQAAPRSPIQLRMLQCAVAALLAALAATAAPCLAADPARTLRVAMTSAEMSFDPQFSADAGVGRLIDHIYDSMLDYDYLARPVHAGAADTGGDADHRRWRRDLYVPFKRGIFFTPDPAFGGKPRELTAADQAYALKRLLDPAVRSPWLWLIEGKIVGADAVRARALTCGKFDYDAPIPGLEVVDRYTLRIRLEAARPALPLRVRGAEYGRRWRAKSSRRTGRTSARIRSAPDRTCSANTGAARRWCCWPTRPIARRRTSLPARCRRSRCRSRQRSKGRGCR